MLKLLFYSSILNLILLFTKGKELFNRELNSYGPIFNFSLIFKPCWIFFLRVHKARYIFLPTLPTNNRRPYRCELILSKLFRLDKPRRLFSSFQANLPLRIRQIKIRFLLLFSLLAVAGIFIGFWAALKKSPSEIRKMFGWFVLVMGIGIFIKEIFIR